MLDMVSKGTNTSEVTKRKLKQIWHLLWVVSTNFHPGLQKQMPNCSEILFTV